MTPYPTFEERLIDYLHSNFPDSREMNEDTLLTTVQQLLQKGLNYGFDTEVDLAIYIATAYMLGENFDTEMPAASEVLTNYSIPSPQKAAWLQKWTQELFQTLAGESPVQAENKPAAQIKEASTNDYLLMQAQAEPYRELALWVTRQLMAGDTSAFIECFSPNFLMQLGMPAIEKVCAEHLLPFFAVDWTLSPSSTITYTTDSFGSSGFAFYMSLQNNLEQRPFIVYLVNENNRIVIANLVVNKSYADMHSH